MFSGLIQAVSKILGIEARGRERIFKIERPNIFDNMELGESIAINGVCLTVTYFDMKCFYVFASHETLSKTGLGHLKISDYINLERALSLSDRLGGHIVLGHVDGVGKIRRKRIYQNSHIIEIEAPQELLPYIVPKGSIAVDGVSLTINSIQGNAFTVNIIPHTIEHTNLKYKKEGSLVNLETDIIGKYIFNFLKNYLKDGSISNKKILETLSQKKDII